MNIFDSIKSTALSLSNKTALIEGERKITYGQLISDTESCANILRQNGISQFDRVGLLCEDSPEYIAASLAILSLSAVVVPITTQQKPEEINAIIEKINLDFFVCESAQRPASTHSCSAAFKLAGKQFLIEKLTPSQNPPPAYYERNPAFIRFSSGTTGTSKGVLLSHESIMDRLDAANKGLQVTSNDVVLWVLSMSFHFVVTILLFLRSGATIVLCGQRYPASLIEGINLHGGTFIYASPFYYSLLSHTEELNREALKNIRLAISTTIKLSEEVATDFYNKFGFELAEAYGIIEVGLPFIRLSGGREKRGSVGKPLPNFELRIDNPDNDGIGEINLKGPGMLDAYFSPWQTRENIRDGGWFKTGDLGKLDADGFLFLAGRSKEVINLGGLKIFAQEVESILNLHPQVAESIVYGVPHPEYGQLPMAKIVLIADSPSVDLDELRQHCAARLAQYKIPKKFEIVAHIPKTASGKVKR